VRVSQSDGEADERRPAMGRLSADWRGDYIESATARDRLRAARGLAPDAEVRCVFCAMLAGGRPDAETHIVHRGTTVFSILNAYPYTSGHAMVMPVRHVSGLSDLDAAERIEIWTELIHLTEVIDRAYGPEGVNVGINLGKAAGAGIPGHLHIHAVPRWNGDTNFMTAVAEMRVVPESLERTWAKLVANW
jgi:ATP adenylyltransferase